MKFNLKLFLTLVTIFIFALCEQNYYEMLGVKRNVNETDLKKAFKKLAIKYHPDKVKDLDDKEIAEKKFAEIANAYETLKDPKTREEYDFQLQHGHPKGQGGGQGGRRRQQQQQYGGFGDFGNYFNSFFGGGGGGGGGGGMGGGGGGFNMNMGGGGGGGGRRQQQQQQQQDRYLFKETAVLEIQMENLTQFFQRQEVWLIIFYNPAVLGRNEAAMQALLKAAEKHKDLYKIAAINCVKEKEICEEEFQQANLGKQNKIIAFPIKGGLKLSQEFSQQQYSAAQLSKFAISLIKTDLVQELNLNNYFKLVDGNKKLIILFTAKQGVPPLFNALANQFEGKFNFVIVQKSQKDIISKFKDIRAFPSILVLTDPYNFSGDKYSGEFKKEPISNFLKLIKGGSVNANFVEFTKEMRDSGTICGKQESKLCLILNLQNDTSLLEQYKNIPSQYSKEPVKFFYVNSGFSDQLQNEPGYILIKGKRSMYASALASQRSITDFIDSALDGGNQFNKCEQEIMYRSIQF